MRKGLANAIAINEHNATTAATERLQVGMGGDR